MSTVLAVLGLALLFAVFGLVRPRHDCGASCGHCAGSCKYGESRNDTT